MSELAWSDAQLERISWENAGRDLVLCVHVTGGNPERRVVTCEWAEAVTIRLAGKRGAGGFFLTWQGTVERLPDGRQSLRLDFGDAGELELVCNDVVITPVNG